MRLTLRADRSRADHVFANNKQSQRLNGDNLQRKEDWRSLTWWLFMAQFWVRSCEWITGVDPVALDTARTKTGASQSGSSQGGYVERCKLEQSSVLFRNGTTSTAGSWLARAIPFRRSAACSYPCAAGAHPC